MQLMVIVHIGVLFLLSVRTRLRLLRSTCSRKVRCLVLLHYGCTEQVVALGAFCMPRLFLCSLGSPTRG